MKILLVDDSAPILRGVEKMIRGIPDYNFDIRKAENAYQALEMMREFAPHLIIADIIMPGMTGLEFLERAFEADYSGKAVLLTAYGEFSYAQQAIRLGVIDYLLKPVEENKLVRLVSELAKKIESPEGDIGKEEPGCLGLPDYSKLDYSAVPPVLSLIMKYVDEHYMDDIALSTLAERCNISATYVCTLFSAHLGATFLSYLDQIRLQYAARLLARTNLSRRNRRQNRLQIRKPAFTRVQEANRHNAHPIPQTLRARVRHLNKPSSPSCIPRQNLLK